MPAPHGEADTYASDANIWPMHPRIARLHSAQSLRFVIAGVTQLLLDWGLFVALSAAGLGTDFANPIARGCVALFGFWLHGIYTFAGDGNRRLSWRNLGHYLPIWTLLTLMGTVALGMITREFGLHYAWLAKPLVEAALAAMSFFAWRRWVFRPVK